MNGNERYFSTKPTASVGHSRGQKANLKKSLRIRLQISLIDRSLDQGNRTLNHLARASRSSESYRRKLISCVDKILAVTE